MPARPIVDLSNPHSGRVLNLACPSATQKMPRNRAALTQPWPLVNQNAPADEFLGNCRRTNPESFAGRTRVGMAAASMVSEPQRRALRLLASSADGVTEALLLANGVSIDVMVEIINAGVGGRTCPATRAAADRGDSGADHVCWPARGAKRWRAN